MAIDRSSLPIVEKMWRREVEAAATYRHLAERGDQVGELLDARALFVLDRVDQ